MNPDDDLEPTDRTLMRRLEQEAQQCSQFQRTTAEAQAQYRDSGAPMWAWLTGRES